MLKSFKEQKAYPKSSIDYIRHKYTFKYFKVYLDVAKHRFIRWYLMSMK